MGFKPIVVINKIDRSGSRADWVLDKTFDLFDRLGASDEQLDFPVVYASALQGHAGVEPDAIQKDMTPLFETIIERVRAPDVDPLGPFQMQVSALDYSSYTGLIGIGRIRRGSIRTNTEIRAIDSEANVRRGRLLTPVRFQWFATPSRSPKHVLETSSPLLA